MLLIILNTQDGNFLDLSLYLCYLSPQHGQWVLCVIINFFILLLIHLSFGFVSFSASVYFHTWWSFTCFNFEISSMFTYYFGVVKSYQKMSFIGNSSLWKYFLLISISWFVTVARTGLVWFSRMCHNRELDPISSISTKASNIKFCSHQLR